MGLDVYVGSLARYYAGDWETIVQQAARQQGLTVKIVRPQPQGLAGRLKAFISGLRPGGPDAALREVNRWRQTLGAVSGLGGKFAWNENVDYEYFTDKPAWDCYGGLVLWAAYDLLPNAKRAAVSTEWANEAAFQAARKLPQNRYSHLIDDTEFWFPVDFEKPFTAPTMAKEPAAVGSSVRLLAELEELNRRTWNASDTRIAEWRVQGAEHGAPLEKSAQLGFAVFYELCRLSVQHRLPMKLDY